MMKGPMFQHSNLPLLIVALLFQRQVEQVVTLILLDLRLGVLDDRRIEPRSAWGVRLRSQARRFLHQGGKTAAICSLEWMTIPS